MTKDMKTIDTLQDTSRNLKEGLEHDAYELGEKVKKNSTKRKPAPKTTFSL